MKYVACLVFVLATPAFGEPTHFEAFDFKNCLRWEITNEMYGAPNSAPQGYVAAVELANQQPYSRHKDMSNTELDRMYEDHPDEVVVVYSALARDMKSKDNKYIERYGVCKPHPPKGIKCLPKQDFPLSGATYQKAPSKGALPTLRCVAGCSKAPATIHDMGYEAMDGERNVEQGVALEKFKKICGRAP